MGTEAYGLTKDLAKILLDPIKERYFYITSFNVNLVKLVEKNNKLDEYKQTIGTKIDEEKDLRKPTQVTKGWLDVVKKLIEEEELKKLIDEESRIRKGQCCFGRIGCNMDQRYKMSKAATEYTQRLETVINERPSIDETTEPISRTDLKSIPTEFYRSLQSRVELMEKVIHKLRDDQANVVGIFGMGAIGKTTLVKEIANENMKDKFGQIVMVEISEAPNIEQIQDQIAEQLSMRSSLGGVHSTQERATRLYNSLKNRKILLILDNVWAKLDLSKVGIPHPHELCCKLLLTSRERNVCEVMGAATNDVFGVHTLDEIESRQLFQARVGDKGQKKEIEDRMLKRCGGLPLSIVALADVLKHQELSMWEHYAIDLEKPMSSHDTIRGVNRLTYSILETSYKLMESEEKKRFFMLACLFPLGRGIPVDDMMRYGIGLGLFQHVNSLTEAMEQAKTWVDELKSSSLLLEDIREGHVKIHDVVRASTISFAEKRGETFMVEAIPRWMKDKTCESYTAISLMADSNHSRLISRGLDFSKLRTLILDKTQPQDIDDAFFKSGMSNLEVLVLQKMRCVSCSPESICQGLKSSLRTLHLEDCQWLDDIRWIGELVNLFDLSLRGSTIKELPEEMGKLSSLCVLDLRGCENDAGVIPASVLANMSQLEGLYAFNAVKKWACGVQGSGVGEGTETKKNDNICGESSSSNSGEYMYASVTQLNKLRHLNALEMKVRLEELPTYGNEFVHNLDQFCVHIYDGEFYYGWARMEFHRSVMLCNLNLKRLMKKRCAEALVKKAESLCLEKVEGLARYLVDDKSSLQHQVSGRIGKELFRGIKQLKIVQCKDDEVGKGVSWTLFPNLESLEIENMTSIRCMIKPSPPTTTTQVPAGGINTLLFSKLQVITLNGLPELHPYVMPIDVLPPNLKSLHVQECGSLKYIYGNSNNYNNNGDHNVTFPIKLPFLKIMRLVVLRELESVMEGGSGSSWSRSGGSTNLPALFNDQKLIFEALETMILVGFDGIATVWDMHFPYRYSMEKSSHLSTTNFHNLKRLAISSCGKLSSLGWLSIADTLVLLKELVIEECPEIREGIIIKREEEESDDAALLSMMLRNSTSGDTLSLFPSLHSLTLLCCPKMERFITTPSPSKQENVVSVGVVEFPSLQSLFINDCPQMQSLSGPATVTFRAPKLSRFEYDKEKRSMPQLMQEFGGDINQILLTCYQQRLQNSREQIHSNLLEKTFEVSKDSEGSLLEKLADSLVWEDSEESEESE